MFALALYPFVLGITTTARGSWMSLVNPKPHASGPSDPPPRDGPDLWATDDALSLICTVVAFLLALVSHCILLSHLTLRKLPGSPRMTKPMSAASGVLLLLSTTWYYVNYLRSSRYGVSGAEWIIFAIFTAAVTILTFVFVLVPLKQKKVVKFGETPP